IDPIEKKPLYHFLPGTQSYSIGSPGCNFQCGFCQNWQISQFKSTIEKSFVNAEEIDPSEIIEEALHHSCESISYTFTEPTIFFEFAYDTAVLASQKNLSNIFVTNGYMTKKAIDKISPYLDAVNIDLKSFRNEFYKKNCRATLKPVLDTIKYMKGKGIWIELTTLIVPGQNDSEKEMEDIVKFIAKTDKRIPWHISRFYPDYQFSHVPPTSLEILEKAKNFGRKHGLKNIYFGNV
ncbi:MAG: AmmeMemoRadiSam system radical SAM enzyme, partial [Candidatus Thermoplasmatota archaeon]|nr:AmmeMemoRadiSam system radical SAM enzyme [Candidatus Thermoplasmatota archaeon]